MMRSLARGFLVAVLAFDAMLVLTVLILGMPSTGAAPAEQDTPANAGQEQVSIWTREALESLGRELQQHSVELARREAELAADLTYEMWRLGSKDDG